MVRMNFDSLAGEFGRRRFLIGALGTGVTLTHASRIFAAEFWNAKDPSTWTEEEIVALTSKSPWSKEAVASLKNAEDPTGATNGDPRSMGRRGAYATIIVRWESAQPVLDALRAPLAADFDGHYVLSVTNLPLANVHRTGRGDGTTQDDALNRLQNGATLQAKGKDPAEAGIARRTRIGSILFGFSKDYLRLTPTDRDIAFTLTTELLTVKTRFDAKEMTYHGKLAV